MLIFYVGSPPIKNKIFKVLLVGERSDMGLYLVQSSICQPCEQEKFVYIFLFKGKCLVLCRDLTHGPKKEDKEFH